MGKQFGSRATADEVLKDFDFTGKNAIITGANSGIGFESAKALAKVGAHVILACRSASKANEAIDKIRAEVPNASLEFMALDLASFPSIEKFTKALKIDQVDLFIQNAGIITDTYNTTPQGHEMTAGVNHFGHFYLTKLLMPLLLKGKARVVVLSSESHRQTLGLNLKKWPQSEKDFGFNSSYAKSKLANVLFASELQRRYGDQGLTVASCHPGNMVTTNFGEGTALTKVLFKLISPFTKTPAQGASTSMYCASQPDSLVAGNYFSGNEKTTPSFLARNKKLAEELWDYSESEVAKYLKQKKS
ncbi:MAG: SDR family NAD(P)-dependent oxidoreductase [Chitinophagales bacterium]